MSVFSALKVLRRDYGVEADMWSLGVMLYILLSGLPPFWGDDESQIFKSVLRVSTLPALKELWCVPSLMQAFGGCQPHTAVRLCFEAMLRARCSQIWDPGLRPNAKYIECPPQAELDFVTPPWPKISAAAKDCVSQLLTVKAEARPSASELLQVIDRLCFLRTVCMHDSNDKRQCNCILSSPGLPLLLLKLIASCDTCIASASCLQHS